MATLGETKSYEEYLEGLKNYEQALIAKSDVTTLNRDKIGPEEKGRKVKIIGLYDRLLPLVREIKDGDYENIHIAAQLLNSIRLIEGREIDEPIVSHSELLTKYLAHPANTNATDRKEDQFDARCGMHALNHILQEEKLICVTKLENTVPGPKPRGRPPKKATVDYSDKVYFDKKTMKPWSRPEKPDPKNREVLLNIPGICKAFSAYIECGSNPCNMIEIGVLQAILSGTIADPDLPNINLGFKTKGVEIVYDKLSDERKTDFIKVEAPIYIELLRILLMEPNTIGALVNFENYHYSAILSKNTMIDVNKAADFTYIDSLDTPCEFGALDVKGTLKQPKYFNKLNVRAPHMTGNYKFDNLVDLFQELLKPNANYTNINITVIKYENDGSSYFCRALEHMLRSSNNNLGGGSLKRNNGKRKTRRSKVRAL